jgi:hypothetical protein
MSSNSQGFIRLALIGMLLTKALGLDYDERVLPSIGNEVLKAIVAQFDAAELITQREIVSLCRG